VKGWALVSGLELVPVSGLELAPGWARGQEPAASEQVQGQVRDSLVREGLK